jgi:hypothetical protein
VHVGWRPGPHAVLGQEPGDRGLSERSLDPAHRPAATRARVEVREKRESPETGGSLRRLRALGQEIREHFAPEGLRLNKVVLNRAESRVHNFVEFIATGRATPALADALSQAEGQVKMLKVDVASMESAQRDVFTPPPPAWIADRVRQLNDPLAARTEKSALACAASLGR